MRRSVFSKTLFDQRWGILGWGLGVGVMALATGIGWSRAYPGAAARATLAAQLRGGLSAAEVLYGQPRNVDQLGGFIEWRALGIAPLLFGLFAILMATGVTRGAEESGTIEVVMAASRSRSRVLREQLAAVFTAIVLAAAATVLLLLPVGALAGEPGIGAAKTAGSVANIALAAALFGAVGLLAAQLFQRRRSAAMAATAIMFVTHFANTLPLVVPSLRAVRYASPLYLTSRSSPLANGHFAWPAIAGVAIAAAAVAALAMLVAGRRDLFSFYRIRQPGARPAQAGVARAAAGSSRPDFLLRSVAGRGLRDAFGSLVAWGLGLAAMSAMFTALVPNIRRALAEQAGSGIAQRLERAGLLNETGILSLVLFSFLPPLATLFGVMLAGGWARDELGQRLDLELACPLPRWRIYIERLVAGVASTAIVAAVCALAILAAAQLRGADVPAGRVLAASALLSLLAAVVVAFGFAAASVRPRMATAAAGGFVAVSYFAALLIPLFNLPGWAADVSVFGLYGQPLSNGVDYPKLAALTVLGAVFVAFGAARFQSRDIAR